MQVDHDASRLARRTPLDLAVHGDVGATVRAVLPLVEQKSDRSFLDDMPRRHADVLQHVVEACTCDTCDIEHHVPIHPEYAASILDELAADDAVFTVDTGMCNVWAARYITPNGRRRVIGSFLHGTMANTLPHAIGAQLAYPGRQVISMSGDGGLGMLLGDLLTVALHRLPVKILTFNNSSLGMVNLEMLVFGLPDSKDYDCIVGPAGTCVKLVRQHFDTIEQTDAARRVRGHTYELVEFLHDIARVHGFPWTEFHLSVGLHDSCSFIRGLRLAKPSEIMGTPFDKTAIRYPFNAEFPGVNLSRSWVWQPKSGQVSYEGKDKDGKPVTGTYVRSQLNSQSAIVKDDIAPPSACLLGQQRRCAGQGQPSIAAGKQLGQAGLGEVSLGRRLPARRYLGPLSRQGQPRRAIRLPPRRLHEAGCRSQRGRATRKLALS